MLAWTGDTNELRSQSSHAHGTSVHVPSRPADEHANEAGGPPTKAGAVGGVGSGQAIELDPSPATPPVPPLESVPPAGASSPALRARPPHAATNTQKSAAHVVDRKRLGRTRIVVEYRARSLHDLLGPPPWTNETRAFANNRLREADIEATR
ncbi:MAG: hypothetical protein WDO69_19755 [Pseudomonadota bacterium]